MRRAILTTIVLLLICVPPLILGVVRVEEPRPPREKADVRLLPGVQPSGAIQLPNQWSLRPAGKQVQLGDFPVNIALHPEGRWLAALHAGYDNHEVVIDDLKRQKIASRVTLDQAFYGVCFSPDGRKLFASGGEFDFLAFLRHVERHDG